MLYESNGIYITNRWHTREKNVFGATDRERYSTTTECVHELRGVRVISSKLATHEIHTVVCNYLPSGVYEIHVFFHIFALSRSTHTRNTHMHTGRTFRTALCASNTCWRRWFVENTWRLKVHRFVVNTHSHTYTLIGGSCRWFTMNYSIFSVVFNRLSQHQHNTLTNSYPAVW